MQGSAGGRSPRPPFLYAAQLPAASGRAGPVFSRTRTGFVCVYVFSLGDALEIFTQAKRG